MFSTLTLMLYNKYNCMVTQDPYYKYDQLQELYIQEMCS